MRPLCFVLRRVPVLIGCLALGVFAGAATPPTPPATNAAQGRERDLGQGLIYHRLQSLPLDLPPKEGPRAPVCVVDLRYLKTDPAGAAAFGFWIGGRATPRAPVFVLANDVTDGALLAAVRTHAASGAVNLIGVPGINFQPDVAVKSTADAERQAYEAFERGATMASLLTDNPGKVRFDETSLGKEHPVLPSEPDLAARPEVPGPVVDLTLQRAVHLHRGLLALKKL